MSAPDLTIALFAGGPAPALHATLASVMRALDAAQEDGALRSEILLLPEHDAPDPRDTVAGLAACDGLRVLPAGPRAAARQAAAAEARGIFLAFLDAGDLWSDNMLRVGLAAALREGARHSVWRPEAVIDCGRVFFDYDLRATIQQPMAGRAEGAALLHACPYASSFLAHRAVLDAASFPAADPRRGALDVDAWWIAECLGAGHAQRILEGTVLYRWNPAEPLPRPVRIGPSRLFAAEARP